MSEPTLVQDAAGVTTSGKTRKGEHVLLVWVLIILSSVAVVLATLAVGVQQLMLNNDRWVATVGPLASNANVQSSIANAAATQLLSAIDLQGRVQGLPPAVQRLVGSAGSGLDTFVHDQALNIAQSAQFATVWTDVNRAVHQSLVELLRGQTQSSAVLRVSDGELQVNVLALAPGLEQSLQQLPVNPLAAAPADFGYVGVASASRLATAQQAVQFLDRATWFLILAAIGLIVATLVISSDRRLATVRLGLGVAIGMLVLGVVLLATQGQILASVADRPIAGAVQVALGAVLLSIGQFMLVVLIAALAVALVAYLTGRSARADPPNAT
jgi:hypothetical protein